MTTADLDGWEAIGRRQLAESYRSQFDEEVVGALDAYARAVYSADADTEVEELLAFTDRMATLLTHITEDLAARGEPFDEEAVDALQAGAETLTAMVEIARDGDADRTAAAVDRAAQQLGDVEEALGVVK